MCIMLCGWSESGVGELAGGGGNALPCTRDEGIC